MEVQYNFNRQISLTFYENDADETGAFRIQCPATGRRPNIEISGTLLPVDYMSNIEIRIVNLYLNNAKTFKRIKVEAGYQNSMSVAFEGEVTNIYDESPGPEKVTVISCVQGRLSKTYGNTVSIKLDKNFSLKTALTQITNGAGLAAPDITFSEEETCASSFSFEGTVQEAVHQLGSLFPDVILLFSNDTIKATKNEKGTNETAKTIKFLQSPPQVVGTTVVLKAPWDPSIKPGDIVTVNAVSFITKGLVTVGKLMKEYRIISVEFRYSTVQGTNQMTLQGYYPEAAQ